MVDRFSLENGKLIKDVIGDYVRDEDYVRLLEIARNFYRAAVKEDVLWRMGAFRRELKAFEKEIE